LLFNSFCSFHELFRIMMVFSAIYPLLLSPIEGRKQQSAAVLPNPSATKQQPQSCLFNRANQQPRILSLILPSSYNRTSHSPVPSSPHRSNQATSSSDSPLPFLLSGKSQAAACSFSSFLPSCCLAYAWPCFIAMHRATTRVGNKQLACGATLF
jgi:hypothetical protein